jgi:hypothetical protein
MLGDGQCIHGWNGKRPREFTWRVLLMRRWWHRVLWGEQPWEAAEPVRAAGAGLSWAESNLAA